MKTFKITVIAGCLGACGMALAQDASERSRAEVRAELQAARADGTLGTMSGEDSGSFAISARRGGSALTRAEVVAQMRAGLDSGESAALLGEDGGSFALARRMPASTLTRAQVVAEMFEARASGLSASLHGEDGGAGYFAAIDARDRVLASARSPLQATLPASSPALLAARVGTRHQQ